MVSPEFVKHAGTWRHSSKTRDCWQSGPVIFFLDVVGRIQLVDEK